MNTTEAKTIKAAMKKYNCDWCGESIDVGSSYESWFTFGENTTIRMHHECFEALMEIGADWNDNEMPTAVTFQRGTCEEVRV